MIVKTIQDRRDKWDSCIDSCIYAYNTAVHESSLYTPFELMFGRKAILPIDIEMDNQTQDNLIAKFNEDDDSQAIHSIMKKRSDNFKRAKENIVRAQEKQKQYYDRKHAKPHAFVVGEKVLVKDFLRKKRAGGKLTTRFIGPYVIVKKASKGIYNLRKLSAPYSEIKVSGAHIKQYVDPGDHQSDEECQQSQRGSWR